VWGGSWAIRRGLFESLRLREAWDRTLSDDLVASRLLADAGLRIIFEPACMVTSPADAGLRDVMGFVRRQYLMGRLYARKGWTSAFLLTALSHLVALGSIGLVAYCLGTGLVAAWIPAGVCGALYLLSVFSGLLRQDLTLSYFPHLHTSLRKARRFELWSGPLVALVNWISLLGSAVGRQVRWRGIVYQVARDGRVSRARREETAAGGLPPQGKESPLPGKTGAPAIIPLPSGWPDESAPAGTTAPERRCA
jgi:hypothetical protein